eukprot:TRINITY_DN15384_c0_g1_i1.p1 TRINITY_DN15384_c0_g1~~TRINITY_DN15384_c0_g1_i1.p1  ORF type:complete len:1250 (+),score=600.00 TRINITY_DN15384_c0_g1_i1:66-3815(+)
MGRSVEELFDLSLATEADAFAQELATEEQAVMFDVLWALAHYSAGNESRQEHLKKVHAALEAAGAYAGDPEGGRLPGLLSDPKKAMDLTNKLRKRANTKNLKIDVHDLKEEEPEGYCKLWAFLLQEAAKQGAEATLHFIEACIGTYNLYPPRCGDLVLTAWEYHVSLGAAGAASFPGAELLALLNLDVVELLGFRYLQHNVDQPVLPAWAKSAHIKTLLQDLPGADLSFFESTPYTLHVVAASLIEAGRLYYSELQPYMQPSLLVLQKEAEDFISKKLTVVDALGGLDKKDIDKDFFDDVGKCKPPACYKYNDHYGLILGLVHIGAYGLAEQLLSGFHDLQPMTYKPLAAGVAKAVSAQVEALAAKTKAEDDEAKAMEDVLAGLEALLPLAKRLGHRASANLKLVSVLMDCLQFCCDKGSAAAAKQDVQDGGDVAMAGDSDNEDAAPTPTRVEALVTAMGTHVLLPALAVLTGVERSDKTEGGQAAGTDLAPPTLSHKLWGLLSCVPYRARFVMYENVNKMFESNDFEMQWAAAKITEATARVLRRLTETDTSGENAKRLAKISCSSPLIMFNTVFRQIMNYGMKIIPYVVDSMRLFTPLAMDVMTYRMLSIMSDPSKERLKADKVYLEDWLTNLGHFTACFFRKHAGMYDLRPMLQYMLWKARMGQSHEMIVLSEVFKAAFIDSAEDLGETELSALEAGPVGRLECCHIYDPSKNNNKIAMKLLAILKKEMKHEGMGKDSVFALAQMYSRCVYAPDPETDFGRNEGVNLRSMVEEQTRLSLVLTQLLSFANLTAAKGEAKGSGELAGNDILPYVVTQLTDKDGIDRAVAHVMCLHKVAAPPLLLSETAEIEAVYGAGADKVAELYLPERFRGELGLYVAFWSMGIRDVADGSKFYKLLQEGIDKREKDESLTKEVQLLKKLRTDAADEAKAQTKASSAALAKLKSNAAGLVKSFDAAKDKPDDLQHLFCDLFQTCLWPRLTMSVDQALFAARFVRELARLSSFPVVELYRFLCKAIPRILSSLTVTEALRAGRFLAEVLGHWSELVDASKSTKDDLAKGHAHLCAGLLRMLSRAETNIYECRLAFQVLQSIKAQFPMHAEICTSVEDAVKPLMKNESMKASATAYTATLQKRRQDKVAEKFSMTKDVMTAYLQDRAPPKKEPVKKEPVKKEPAVKKESVKKEPEKKRSDVKKEVKAEPKSNDGEKVKMEKVKEEPREGGRKRGRDDRDDAGEKRVKREGNRGRGHGRQ